jgi:hypothetical protein
MARRKASNHPAYDVGYRRPPKATQFKPGRSGNPKGRPRGRRPIGAILQEIMERKVSVTENGKTRRLSALEIMLRRLTNDAVRSDHRAIKLLVYLLDRYGDTPETSLEVNELLAEDQEILRQYVGAQPNIRTDRTPAAAKRTGRTNAK